MVQKIPLRKIKKIVKEYIRLLRADGFIIEKVLLYGSYVKGASHRDSDIDICIISKNFGGNPQEEGKYLFRKLWMMENANLEPIGYSPKYFYDKQNQSPLINEIQKNSIELKV